MYNELQLSHADRNTSNCIVRIAMNLATTPVSEKQICLEYVRILISKYMTIGNLNY